MALTVWWHHRILLNASAYLIVSKDHWSIYLYLTNYFGIVLSLTREDDLDYIKILPIRVEIYSFF